MHGEEFIRLWGFSSPVRNEGKLQKIISSFGTCHSLNFPRTTLFPWGESGGWPRSRSVTARCPSPFFPSLLPDRQASGRAVFSVSKGVCCHFSAFPEADVPFFHTSGSFRASPGFCEFQFPLGKLIGIYRQTQSYFSVTLPRVKEFQGQNSSQKVWPLLLRAYHRRPSRNYSAIVLTVILRECLYDYSGAKTFPVSGNLNVVREVCFVLGCR